jgi:hypothetical protein
MADFNSSILIQTPIERQFAQIRCPPMGERERSVAPGGVNHCFTDDVKKIRAPVNTL